MGEDNLRRWKVPVMPFVRPSDVLACSRSSRVFQHDARTRKARRIHCESLFLVAKWVEGRLGERGRKARDGRARSTGGREVDLERRAGERASERMGRTGGGEGGKTAN